MRYFIYTLSFFSLFAETELPFLDNSRLSLDLTSRTSYWQKEDQLTQQEFIGLDYHQILSFEGQEFGQLTLQPFLYRIDNGHRTPGIYDDDHDWEFVVRTAVINFNGFGADKPYIKLGHFEIPFGVEYTKDTFGDLHQYGQGSKMGMKMDWGLAIGQELEAYKYEFSLVILLQRKIPALSYFARKSVPYTLFSIKLSEEIPLSKSISPRKFPVT